MSLIYKTVDVEIEVDLDDFDDDDLIEELAKRGTDSGTDFSEQINEIFYAFKFGRDDLALELTRKYICNATGKIL